MSINNRSIFFIPAAWLIPFGVHVYSTTFSAHYDKTSPRTYVQVMEKDQTIDQTKDRLIRINGAKQNGFEGIGFFAGAVIAGNLAGLPERQLYGLGAGYLLSRILYTAVYMWNTNPKWSDLRSVLWVLGVGQVVALYVLSAVN